MRVTAASWMRSDFKRIGRTARDAHGRKDGSRERHGLRDGIYKKTMMAEGGRHFWLLPPTATALARNTLQPGSVMRPFLELV